MIFRNFSFRNFLEVHGRPEAPSVLPINQSTSSVLAGNFLAGNSYSEGTVSYVLHWSTISHYPLLEYRILYKKVPR
jgi:hypothetical protein